MLAPGWILVSKSEPGLWFIFHHGPEGTAAIDLTREHPDIAYRGFESVLKTEDTTPAAEKVVLLGGPERPDDALIVLHDARTTTTESHVINGDFSFLPYNYVLLPGHPPAITTDSNRPADIRLGRNTRFLIVLGYRTWEGDSLLQEIQAGIWRCIPATPVIVLHTPRQERRNKILQSIN